MDEILYKHIAIYFDSIHAPDKIRVIFLPTNTFKAPNLAFIQCRTSKRVTAEPVVTKMEKYLNAQILGSDMNDLRNSQYHYRFDTKLFAIW